MFALIVKGQATIRNLLRFLKNNWQFFSVYINVKANFLKPEVIWKLVHFFFHLWVPCSPQQSLLDVEQEVGSQGRNIPVPSTSHPRFHPHQKVPWAYQEWLLSTESGVSLITWLGISLNTTRWVSQKPSQTKHRTTKPSQSKPWLPLLRGKSSGFLQSSTNPPKPPTPRRVHLCQWASYTSCSLI